MSEHARILVAALELDFRLTESRERAEAKVDRARTPRQIRRARKQLNRTR
jgi:hypothetical protein